MVDCSKAIMLANLVTAIYFEHSRLFQCFFLGKIIIFATAEADDSGAIVNPKQTYQ